MRLAEVLWRDAERNGVPVPGPVGWFRSCWDFPLPTDRRGRVQVASAVIGYSLALLRDLPGRVQVGDTLFGGPSFGAALLAATVMRLNAGSSPVRLLGHGDWLQYLPLLVPVRTRTRLRELDEGFGDLALRGEDGWIGEEVPDLFENAPMQGRSWQRLTQTVVGAWAERRFAERLDPYGRYSDGSWPVPPPDQALPEAYRQFAALLEHHAREGRLFGDADG
ncbi:hypothetical protein [Micropruina sonneratiae]|uniref:hypothetical protein n=1 Tax=Micropruina sonneratiae TaxID=2986940 RepID=UPI002226B248|nr:hypothetical protein [Micropruina sp. KQZ13P-5]MCW3158985.1 hypothetical protein [Micropruina sp. KQZ13P-5]